MVKYRSENGVNLILYLEEALGMEKLECFLVNKAAKSVFQPVEVLEWNMFIRYFCLRIPQKQLFGAK